MLRTIETLIDEQVRKAREEGAFDNLSSNGKPLKIDGRQSAVDVWLERTMADEGLSLPLPDGLQLRKDVAAEVAALRGVRDESEVRQRLAVLNARIRQVNSRLATGPSSKVAPLDVERFLASWRHR